jgi:rRNA maturation protein Rpf1
VSAIAPVHARYVQDLPTLHQSWLCLQTVFPSAVFYKRQGYALKKIIEYAKQNGFTDVVVVNEDKKVLNGMVVCHLPDGPTAVFNLSSVILNRDIKGRGKPTDHKPELVLNNFGTRLGYRIGRMFGSLFCQDPTFRGRRVITFHNQRDYIFFRHHRYAFEEKERDVVATTVKDGKKKVKATGSETYVHPRLQVGIIHILLKRNFFCLSVSCLDMCLHDLGTVANLSHFCLLFMCVLVGWGHFHFHYSTVFACAPFGYGSYNWNQL